MALCHDSRRFFVLEDWSVTQMQNRQPSGSSDIPATICEALDRAVALRPDTEALVGNGERITFDRLRNESLKVARGLVASGIRRGDHVAICAGNSVEWGDPVPRHRAGRRGLRASQHAVDARRDPHAA